MTRKELKLFSPLTPQECASLLDDQVNFDLLPFSFMSSRALLGSVSEEGMRIKRSLGAWGARQVLYELRGKMTAGMYGDRQGTVIQGQFGMDLQSKLSLVMFYLIGSAFFLISGVSEFNALNFWTITNIQSLFPIHILLALFILSPLICHLMLLTRTSDILFITKFLIDTLEAESIQAEVSLPPGINTRTPR